MDSGVIRGVFAQWTKNEMATIFGFPVQIFPGKRLEHVQFFDETPTSIDGMVEACARGCGSSGLVSFVNRSHDDTRRLFVLLFVHLYVPKCSVVYTTSHKPQGHHFSRTDAVVNMIVPFEGIAWLVP